MTAPPNYTSPQLGISLLRLSLRVLALLAIAFIAQALVMAGIRATDTLPDSTRGATQISLVVLVLLLYAGMIAIPFVPGVEIGVTLLLLRGADVAPFVYLATLCGLLLAYFAGRALPYRWLHDAFLDLRLHRACALLDRIAELSPERRLATLRARLPAWLGPYLVRYRYLMLAVALNVPGNSVVGGGGGLCLLAGFSKLYLPGGTIAALALGTLPIPLLVWSLGPGVLSRF